MVEPQLRPVTQPLAPVGRGGRIGLVALATDLNSERDLRKMAPADVEIFTGRVVNANPVTVENLRAMQGDLTRAAAGILPNMRLDAIAYGCTSGAAVIGEEAVVAAVRAARHGIAVTHPVAALSAAARVLGLERVALLAPYSVAVTKSVADSLSDHALSVVHAHCFGLESDEEMTAVPPSAIAEAALSLVDASIDGLVISCTALRAAGVAGQIERVIGRAVLTSNQAMLWHALRLIGNQTRIDGFGRLMHLPLAMDER